MKLLKREKGRPTRVEKPLTEIVCEYLSSVGGRASWGELKKARKNGEIVDSVLKSVIDRLKGDGLLTEEAELRDGKAVKLYRLTVEVHTSFGTFDFRDMIKHGVEKVRAIQNEDEQEKEGGKQLYAALTVIAYTIYEELLQHACTGDKSHAELRLSSALKDVIVPAIKQITELSDLGILYLFSWGEVPGNDSGRLIEFLKQKFDINWDETVKIEKNDDGRTIRVSDEKNRLSLELNDEKNEVNLKIDDGRIGKFSVKTENGKLNIYSYLYTKHTTRAIEKAFLQSIKNFDETWEQTAEKDDESNIE